MSIISLPKLTIPTYTTFLPISKIEVKYRPFVMREEKALMIAADTGTEDEMVATLREVLKSCVIQSDKQIDLDVIPLVELQYLFIQLRMKSIGETAELEIKCTNCEFMNPVKIDLSQMSIKVDPTHNKKIELSDTIGLVMKYPNVKMMDKLDQLNNIDILFEIIGDSIEYVYDGETIISTSSISKKDILEFIESMTEKDFNKIQEFFNTLPKLTHEIPFTCSSCGTKNNYMVEGIGNFF